MLDLYDILYKTYKRSNKPKLAMSMLENYRVYRDSLESEKFNDKFSKNLLEHGAKNFMQGIYLGYMYSRWRKIRDLD